MTSRRREWAALWNVLQALRLPAMITAPAGEVLYVTDALQALLDGDLEPEALRCAIDGAIEECRQRIEQMADPAEPLSVREVRAGNGRYEVRAVPYRAGSKGPTSFIVVAVERIAAVRRSQSELKEAFSLTPAEVKVALLLLRGLSNAEIAQQLSVSQFTARRHTERVLKKLNVRSRAEVAERLLS